MATLALDRPAPGGDEPALQRSQGRVALSGNELIVKGALEGGVSLITGYPGSPVADVFTICERAAGYLRTLGVEASIANNEAQSAAMLNGARQVPGARPMAIFKSVGAYVALDALAIANSARPAAGAGAVVVVGDDPEMSSTQVGADSRLTLSAARIPVLEPSSWQGLKELVTAAFELSVESELVVAVMLTTIQADGGGVVELGPNRPPAVGPLRRVALDTRAVRSARAVSLPPQVTELTNDLLERRVPLLQEAVRARGLDVLEGPREPAPIGFVTAGASYTLLRHALYALGIDGRLPVLRLALTSPIDPVAVRRLAGLAGEVMVVEERSGHLEDQVRRVLGQQAVPVWGKRFPGDADGLPEAGALDPDLVAAALGRLVLARPAAFPAPAHERARALAEPPPTRARPALLERTPTYCAGCPHRGTNSPILEIRERLRDPAYMRRKHGRGPVDLIAHGGIGCYSMAMLPPFEEMHDLSAMGLGGATGAGSAPHTTNKHYTLVGDGSFFHGEMSTITNAIKQRQDILFIILDNKTTAMTGHQGTPGSDRDLMGRPQTPLEIERIVAAMGPTMLVRSNPDDREAHMALLERAVLAEGTRVVIADKECAITSGRRKRAERARVEAEHGFRPEVTRINVVEEVCENCRECTTATGCPGLTVVQTALGEKIGIDDQVCVDDGYCAAIKACPSFERVTVARRSAPVRPAPSRPEPPEPDPPPAAGSAELAVHVAGVGGLGIALVTRVVVEAAAEAWPGLDVYQKRGMAQRGGGVYSQIVLHDGTRPRSPAIPRGRADLIIGLDALEGTRALDVASSDRTVAVVDTHRRQTTTSLMGVARYPDDLRERLSSALRPCGLLALDLSAECAREFGDAIHANVAALGAAWQRGWLPLERAALERAIRSVYGAGAEANLAAFELGRALAAKTPAPHQPEDVEAVLAREAGWIRKRSDRRAFEDAVARARDLPLGDVALGMLAPRLPELLAWDGPDYAGRYLDGIARVAGAAPALIPAIIHNLHRAMAIKDEVFVAHQLTSPRKLARDRERFDVDPRRGDRISYVHLNRPSFEVLGRTIRFNMETRDWQLRLFARARILRRLLPGWHVRELAFRDWYEGEVIGAVADGRLAGEAAHEALRLPERVTGYREVRYPKEDAAYARFAELLEAAGAAG